MDWLTLKKRRQLDAVQRTNFKGKRVSESIVLEGISNSCFKADNALNSGTFTNAGRVLKCVLVIFVLASLSRSVGAFAPQQVIASAVVIQEGSQKDQDGVEGNSEAGETEAGETEEDSLSDSRRNRLVAAGFFGAIFLALLGVLFAYLRLDHASRGFHSGRLQMIALAVIGLIGLIGYLLWTQFLF